MSSVEVWIAFLGGVGVGAILATTVLTVWLFHDDRRREERR